MSSAAKDALVQRVVTYNVRACLGLDGRRSAERIARILEATGASLIGLQELSVDVAHPGDGVAQADWLARRLDMSIVEGCTLQRRGGNFGNALLSRAPLSRPRVHPLPAVAGEPRNVIEAEVEHGERPLRVFVTHLGLLPAERRHQASVLASIVGQRPVEGADDVEVLVMGDLNAWGRRWTLAPLVRVLGKSRQVRTFPARFPLLALDRIWLESPTRTLRTHAFRDADSRIASDHLPLVGELVPVRGAAP